MNQPYPPDRSLDSLHYSLRRYFVDDFHFRHVPGLKPGSRVLDLGGNKTSKRGAFDIEHYGLRVVYSNLSTAKRPDVQADAAHIPFKDASFEAVVCSELLEHVPHPPAVLREIHRVLPGGGTLLLCAPFLYPIHGDPGDYGRYTDSYWREVVGAKGFDIMAIERQGSYWCVLSDMLRELVLYMGSRGRPRVGRIRGLMNLAILRTRRLALAWDAGLSPEENSFYGNYTTGFGVVAVKKR
jgi:SAM-dependent methyltransferase